MNLEKYANAKVKADKSKITAAVVERLREGSPNGGFVKKDATTGKWISVDDAVARAMVGHALRDAFALSKVAVEKSMAPSGNNGIVCHDVRLVEAQNAMLRSAHQRSPNARSLWGL